MSPIAGSPGLSALNSAGSNAVNHRRSRRCRGRPDTRPVSSPARTVRFPSDGGRPSPTRRARRARSAGSDKGGGERGAEADDGAEFQIPGRPKAELLAAEPATGQAHERLVLILVAPVLAGRWVA